MTESAKDSGHYPLSAGEQGHQEMESAMAVTGEGQRRQAAVPCSDRKFFVQFPEQRCLRRFARSTRLSLSISATAAARMIFTCGSPH